MLEDVGLPTKQDLCITKTLLEKEWKNCDKLTQQHSAIESILAYPLEYGYELPTVHEAESEEDEFFRLTEDINVEGIDATDEEIEEFLKEDSITKEQFIVQNMEEEDTVKATVYSGRNPPRRNYNRRRQPSLTEIVIQTMKGPETSGTNDIHKT